MNTAWKMLYIPWMVILSDHNIKKIYCLGKSTSQRTYPKQHTFKIRKTYTNTG